VQRRRTARACDRRRLLQPTASGRRRAPAQVRCRRAHRRRASRSTVRRSCPRQAPASHRLRAGRRGLVRARRRGRPRQEVKSRDLTRRLARIDLDPASTPPNRRPSGCSRPHRRAGSLILGDAVRRRGDRHRAVVLSTPHRLREGARAVRPPRSGQFQGREAPLRGRFGAVGARRAASVDAAAGGPTTYRSRRRVASRRRPRSRSMPHSRTPRIACRRSEVIGFSLGARPAHLPSAGDDAVPAHRQAGRWARSARPAGRAGRAPAPGRRPSGRGRVTVDGDGRSRVPSRGTELLAEMASCRARTTRPARPGRFVTPGWPAPWGRDAKASKLLVIQEEFRAAKMTKPNIGVGGGVAQLIVHGTGAAERWIMPTPARRDRLVHSSATGAGSDLASL